MPYRPTPTEPPARRKAYPSDLSDAEWEVLARLFPPKQPLLGRRRALRDLGCIVGDLVIVAKPLLDTT
jgi:hypothetical protein